MSISTEITRLQTSKADVKTQVNIDKELINGGTTFIGNETVDDYDDKIKEMQEAYKKFIPIQTETGTTNVLIDNTSDDKVMTDIALYGNSEQFTTTGKNLCEGTFRQGVASGTGNTTRLFSQAGALLTNGTTYTVSTNLDTTAFEYALVGSLTQYPSGTVVSIGSWNTTSYYTYTATDNYYLGITIKRSNSSNLTPSDIEGCWFQIEVGSSATTYEPYTGRNSITKLFVSTRY